jgi:hypothetical protein
MTVGRPAWEILRPQVNRVVEGLRDGLGDTLGDQLVGLYLSGSLALGGFHPPSSDVDVLVATAGVLDEPVVGRLAELHATLRTAGGLAARLEVVYLPVTALRGSDPSDQCTYGVVCATPEPEGELPRPEVFGTCEVSDRAGTEYVNWTSTHPSFGMVRIHQGTFVPSPPAGTEWLELRFSQPDTMPGQAPPLIVSTVDLR